MDINVDNYEQELPNILKHVDDSDFLSIDLEFSGISIHIYYNIICISIYIHISINIYIHISINIYIHIYITTSINIYITNLNSILIFDRINKR